MVLFLSVTYKWRSWKRIVQRVASCAIMPMGKIVGKAVFLEQKATHACLWKNKRFCHVTKYWSTL